MKLRDEILHALHILKEDDRDLESIVIYCNPNWSRGTDNQVRKEVKKCILNLIKEGKIKRKNNGIYKIV